MRDSLANASKTHVKGGNARECKLVKRETTREINDKWRAQR